MTNTTNNINNHITSTGKRKNATACLKYNDKYNEMTVNNKPWEEFFSQERHRLKILTPFKVTNLPVLNNLKFKVMGGGITAQAEAVRHSISKLLKTIHIDNAQIVKALKENKLLTRDPRKKERNKPGQRGARAQFNSKKR
jgi:small subunit ribosomal protein S9